MKTTHSFRLNGLLLGGLALLAGCAMGPDYERPTTADPGQFRSATTTASEAASIADLPWWEMYEDPDLKRLIEEALKNNYNLRIAISRVEQARALSAQARSAFFPQVGYQGSMSRGRNEALGSPSYNGGMTNDPVFAGVSASWEIDLWGRVRRLNEAAQAELLATEAGQRAVMLILVSEVARNYYELLTFDLRLSIAQAATESFKESYDIFQTRLEGGVASRLQTAAAEGAMASAAAGIPEFERQIAIKENQLSILLGKPPGPISRDLDLISQKLPIAIPVGLPSSLLERRPDIIQSEQLLRAANARIGVAEANFFPQLNLTGLLGRVSPELSAFTAGAGNAWSIAAGLAGPIFEGGLLRAQYRQAVAAWEESVASYELTVLQAFQEVSNALISFEKLAQVRNFQAQSVNAYTEAVVVAFERYASGKADYYEVLQVQQDLFPVADQLAQTRLSQFLSLIDLYQALGGGWSQDNKAWMSAGQVEETDDDNKTNP